MTMRTLFEAARAGGVLRCSKLAQTQTTTLIKAVLESLMVQCKTPFMMQGSA